MTGIDTREELRRSAVKHLWMHNRGWAEMAERGEPVIMTSRSFPVGWVPEAAYEEQCVHLQPDDRLYFYSDGINEAMNGQREQFGEARIVEAGRTCRGMSLQASLDELASAAEAWSERGFEDDATLMAIERSPAN